MVDRAIRLDGTCSGEHGVGLGKIEYLESELGVGTVGLMETIKRTSTSSLPSLARRRRGKRHPCPIAERALIHMSL